MKFVDEATIRVQAGNGGAGCASFRREKYIPRGGPDGGDGGSGGSVYLLANSGINTLADFRVTRKFAAGNGQPGMGKERTGRGGEDLIVLVPAGTRVFASETNEFIGDLTEDGQRLLVALGGTGGKGNIRFKSSTNRAPRQSTQGTVGERLSLNLELTLLADVGLLGMPNAGKSTLISAVSAARPKIADYPFTTLYPNLGVVSADPLRSFVMADIPGLVEGAADGIGLGIRFLKHLSRTRLLLHLVDMAPMEGTGNPAEEIVLLAAELARYSSELAAKERWLVLNKSDLLPDDEQSGRQAEIIEALNWSGPVYQISALSRQGTSRLVADIMSRLERIDAEEASAEAHPEV